MAPHTTDNAQKKKHKSDEKLKHQQEQPAAAVVLNLRAGEEITGLTRDEMASVGSVPIKPNPTTYGNSRWVRGARRRMSG
ncbi:unnamed protein product, partial [Ectocarpus fasciculatus]